MSYAAKCLYELSHKNAALKETVVRANCAPYVIISPRNVL